MKTKQKCLNPNCTNESSLRGVCKSCYVTAARLVKEKKTTWEELEKNGKCLPSSKSSSKVSEWLLSK